MARVHLFTATSPTARRSVVYDHNLVEGSSPPVPVLTPPHPPSPAATSAVAEPTPSVEVNVTSPPPLKAEDEELAKQDDVAAQLSNLTALLQNAQQALQHHDTSSVTNDLSEVVGAVAAHLSNKPGKQALV